MVLTVWRMPTPAMQEYLKRGMLSILLCVNQVCAGTLDVHEWVSESTIAEQDEEVIGRDADDEICIPCVVQWRLLWFSAPTRSIQTLEGEETIAKYHNGVNMTIAEAISMPLGGSHKPRSCMLTTVAAVLQKKTESVNKDLKGLGMEGRLVLLPFVEGSDKRSPL